MTVFLFSLYFKIILHLDFEFDFFDELLNLAIVRVDGSDFFEAFERLDPLAEIDVVDGGKIENIGIVRIFLQERIGVFIGLLMVSELVGEIREHIDCLLIVLIEREESFVYLVGDFVLSLNRECEAEFEVEFRVRIIHENEVLVDKLRLLVIPVFLIKRCQKTIELLIELLDGKPLYDAGSGFTEFSPSNAGFDILDELDDLLFFISRKPFEGRLRIFL